MTSATPITPGSVVIRRNDDGTLDEVIVPNCHAHLEQMGDNHWWLGLDLSDGTHVAVNLWTGRALIRARVDIEDRS